MTNELFWKLYNSGEINIVIFEFKKERRDIEIDAFEYANKYYLRICTVYEPYTLDRTAECGKRYRVRYNTCNIKEFNNKYSANKYFKAIRANA